MAELANQKENFAYATSASLPQSQEALETAIDSYGSKATYLLVGQPDDVDVMKTFLENQGISSQQIKSDSFRGLK